MPSHNYSTLPTSEFNLQSDDDVDIQNSAHNDSTDIPDLPPAYDPSGFQEFELDDDIREDEGPKCFRLKFTQNFKQHIVQPINNALDPVYQFYCYANAKFEFYISKMGNPLIIKRVLYIITIALILYFASLSGLNSDGVVGAHSDFMDPFKLLKFVDLSVSPSRLEENLEYLSSMPHLSGTAGDLALSRYFEELLIKGSLIPNPDIIFESFTNYPLNPKVQLLNNDEILIDCDLKENFNGEIENDFYKFAFNPGSQDMTSRGKLIYVNYGTLSDYKLLEDKSINFKDSILLIKYGGIYPAFKKLKYAQEKGALGVLFISDPELDNYYNLESIQREPVSFTDEFPGNVLSSIDSIGGMIDHSDNFKQKLESSKAHPLIPSIPIKWKDFIAIMNQISNQGIRIEEWDIEINGINIPIWTGENYEILLENNLNTRPFKESWNIIGKLEAKEQETFSIIIGASRDTMCYGAIESSGSAILLELMNIFSEMSSSLSWNPLRQIYFVSYSGSKYNLAGSSNFMNKYPDFFRRNAYAYIDLEDIIQGYKSNNILEISTDPLFESLIRNAVNDIINLNSTNSNININTDNLNDIKYNINPNSNSFPLIERHNIGSISIKLKEDENKFNIPYYPKNSCLDTFDNFIKNQVDPDMSKHAFMTKLISSIIIKLADTPILPYDVRNMFETIKDNVNEVKEFSKSISTDDNSMIIDFVEIDHMLDAVMIIASQHEAFVTTWSDICDDGYGSEPNLLSVNRWDWNSKLLILNKIILNMDGVFDHPWQHNVLYGIENDPELRYQKDITNIDVKQNLPGVWNAIDKGDWVNAQVQINIVSEMLDRCMQLFQY